ncbi:hypothetical protein BBK82_37220 [Lentzea guizhouensis]|uniref:Oxidoreductase n=1 Tax=Lentzea guizhouensis TaxID=1586287 RepID=A0A1B2HSX6_9PSEU|nr:Gfo/Idh/MocA family oxidoreductase [Lentzea guizhouensis]ANZ40798.1 hypothetical protein BBK82_37220 [Lentzea guizhouensis]
MKSPVRLGLIGCGRIAQVAHLPALEKADGVDLLAVCDPDAAVAGAVARRYHISTVHTDAANLLADPSVEAVLVAAPDRFHFDLADAALAAGKHVLVEKPLAATVKECEQLVARVRATGLTLQVGAMKRHDPGLEFAHRFVGSRLGEIRAFHAWYRIGSTRPGVEATLFPKVFADDARRDAESAFKADRERYLLATHGAHVFDTVRFLLGDVRAVTAKHRGFGRDHSWSVLLTLASGAVGTATITVDVAGDGAEGIEVFGASGQVEVRTHFPFFRRASDVRAYCDGAVTVPVFADTDAYERQAEAFARAVRGDVAVSPDATDGLEAVRLITAVERSVVSGAEVEL